MRPALSVFNFGDEFVRLVDIKSPVRLNDFLRVRMRPIHGDMEVIIARVLVQGVNCLVFGKAHSPEKKADSFVHLFTGGLLVFLPRQNPVRDRHFAREGFLGKRNHLFFLSGDSRCQKILASGVGELVLAPVVVFGKDV